MTPARSALDRRLGDARVGDVAYAEGKKKEKEKVHLLS
jgi:hypothetical protein